MDLNLFSSKKTLLAIMLGLSLTAQGVESNVVVKHLANEQNIIVLDSVKKFLLLPVQESAPEGKVNIIVNNELQLEQNINVRLAREKVDYYVPLDLSAFQGKTISIDVTGMPSSSLCWKKLKLSDTFDSSNHETYRPVYHHTPMYGWMNDPNGMFYKDGVYHLYFQYNPYGSMWANMTWGHSTSTDLVNWKYEGNAIVPDAWGAIFSGSCIVDYNNVAGFGKGAVIAFYTSAKSTLWGDVQTQSMAYSLDNGMTFTKYENNPILTSDARDFRDPKVFWYAPGKHWVMILAVGQEMQIYTSVNLKEWNKESSFGAKQGAHGGVWECPDLVELPVEGTNEKKWVLICNLNPGGPFGGSAAQYFVGTFNGKKFVNESPTQTKWLDWGKDNYATVTWNNAPNGRCIALGWMSNWQYQSVLPTSQYRGENTIARDLKLYKVKNEYYLKSIPSPEVETIRTKTVFIPSFKVSDKYEIATLLDDNKGAYELEMVLSNSGSSKITLTLSNTKGEHLLMYYDIARKQFIMDRSESGKVDFSVDFPAVTVAPVEDINNINLRLFIDRSSVEAFGENGKYVMTNRIFPSEPYNKITFETERGNYSVKSLKVYKLK
ncbi:GH32 C-terminal domain-containing protein [Phocaeicola sp.]|uniref:GH32 C-terminal domain-containing protein n=1 Tax=Phocaeicola sp. TaxID=2773926 RepID=UPI00386E583D